MIFDFIKKISENFAKSQKAKEDAVNQFLAEIDDPIVKQSAFIPLKKGGSNITSHTMETDNYGNIIFKIKSFFPLLFLGMFSIPLIATLAVFALNIQDIDSERASEFIGGLIISTIFLLPAFLLFYFLFRSYIFDFQNGYFYDTQYQKKLFELMRNTQYSNKIVPIGNIHALQIVSERVQGNKTSFTSFELNLILKDSTRVNVIDHGNLEEIRNNAQTLASALGVKVYDLTLSFIDDGFQFL